MLKFKENYQSQLTLSLTDISYILLVIMIHHMKNNVILRAATANKYLSPNVIELEVPWSSFIDATVYDTFYEPEDDDYYYDED